MIARCLLVFALVALSFRGLYLLYLTALKNPFLLSQSVERPSNRKISYEMRDISVGTARSKSKSSISTQKTTSQSLNTSYSSYRSQNRKVR